jgi:taurine dioxygenase
LQANYHHPEHPEIFVSSNIVRDGKKIGVSGTGQYWHSDYSFMEEPLPLTMQYPQVSGKGRSTYYIDMQRVYEALPAHLKERVENGWAVHDPKMRYKVQSKDIDRAIIDILDEISQIRPPVQHPAVITHPVTRTKSLYVNEGFTAAIVGLAELFAFIKREEHIHTHLHQHGDILLWDNRSLIHMASKPPAGEPNETFRIGVYDGLPFHVH